MSEEKIEKTVGAEDQGGWKIILPDKREVIIDRELVVLGRQEGSVDILIDDKMLSRKHCKFILQGQKLILEDLGSRNGTFVNNRKVTRIELSSGDVIRVGGTELKVEFFRARSGYETISALLSGETLEIGSDIREQIREREKKEEIREREKKEEKPRYGEKRKKIGVFVVWGGSVIVSSAFIITAVLSYNKSLYQEALQVMRQTYNIANFYYQRFDFEAAQTYANILLKLVDRFSKYGDFSKVQKTVSELIEKLDKERENRNKLIYALKKMTSGDLEGAFSDLG
ncbi:MAG: FHA domain-containing protein, partial [Candidatus Micrarchaeia archaeon]